MGAWRNIAYSALKRMHKSYRKAPDKLKEELWRTEKYGFRGSVRDKKSSIGEILPVGHAV
ncbi:hypothetical protein F2P79_022421 [Pimephales promelas]|nr:hypothetical protein F2P79_022421 [Pimephales promelas]